MPSSEVGGYDKAREKYREERSNSSKGGLGGFTSFKDMFDGGGPGKSGPSFQPTAANRPQSKPSVLKTGTGENIRYLDTTTGQSYAAPKFGSFSFQGLTSSDPANVLRNRYGAERMNATSELNSLFERMRERRERRDRRDRSGIASLPTKQPPPPTPQELAQIGASNAPLSPVLLDSPIYGMPDQNMLDQNTLDPNMLGYGSAFSNLSTVPQFSLMDLYDLFGSPTNFGR